MAVFWAIEILRPYLYGERFTIHTDHPSIRCLLNVSDPSGCLIRWRLCLSEFDFELKYKKASSNTQADALSRIPTEGEASTPIDEDITCFLTGGLEHSAADYDTCDDLLELEGGRRLMISYML